jgi:acyl carrier protein
MTELIIEWVRENGQSEPFSDPEITEETDLMASGLLDSFGFIDLLLFIESQSGTKIDLMDVDPSQFVVVKGLCNIALANSNNDLGQPLDAAVTN